MSFLRKYPRVLVILPLVIMGLYIAALETNGFWDKYGFSVPTEGNNSMQSFDTLQDINKISITMVCDVNPEAEACADVPVNSLSQVEQLTFINRMVRGAYAVLITLIKLQKV